MCTIDGIEMDFGDDDDADEFLTGKLAALGIDEDLELSGGEEENEDPAVIAAAAMSPEGPPASPPAKEAGGGEAPPPNTKPPPPAVGGEGGGREGGGGGGGGRGGEEIEDGELLELLEKPLQASRGRSQQRGSRDNNNRGGRDGGGFGGGGDRKGGDGRGRRHPKSNGRAFGRNVTIKECARWMCERLGEPKYYLMCRVVATIGYTKTKILLEKVRETQDAGGMPTADGSRKRTAGGVFFTLLKEHMEPAKLKELYADEVRVKKEKDRARRAANKRKAEAALAGEDVMTPRDPPRQRPRGGGGRGSGGAARAWRGSGPALRLVIVLQMLRSVREQA